jgi:hypothetical protein
MYDTLKEKEGGFDHIAVGMGIGMEEMTILIIAQRHYGEETSCIPERQEELSQLILKVGYHPLSAPTYRFWV